MRRIIYAILFCLCNIYMSAQATTDTIRIVENFSVAGQSPIVNTVLPKAERLSTEKGVITFNFINEIPDSIKTSISVAGDIWSHYLDEKAKINIDIEFTPLENDIEIDIIYHSETNDADTYYPSCLYNYLYGHDDDNASSAKIYINSNSVWECGYSNNYLTSASNMTYATMRAIASVMGFGSSVFEKTYRNINILNFKQRSGYSAFDRLIFNSAGKRLDAIGRITNSRIDNAELRTFCQPQGDTVVYAGENSYLYKLYAPTPFQRYKSLLYLDNASSLMHYDLQQGNKVQVVDNITANILNKLGWNSFQESTVKIVGQNIPESGIASGYESHTFSVTNPTGINISNAIWTYKLPLANGGDTIISQVSNVLNFQIPAIENENLYKINVNGDIYGTIMFEGMQNGNEIADVYTISLGLKPQIKSVEIINTVPTGLYGNYDLYFNVDYIGSDYIYVVKEEEYGSSAFAQFVYEPFLAHVKVENVTSDYWVWIDLFVENEYGETVYTIEIPVEYNLNAKRKVVVASINDLNSNYDDQYFDVYDITGALILKHGQKAEINNLDGGLYLIKCFIGEQCIKTIKYQKR